ncbi:biotin/lipoyl-binding protein [Xylella fastidiosa]|uniref:biotin/lipoyl-binding protein n=1 Tax=Xylella fastidiosa TaxID=2371 RepID=UPI003DA60054
MNNSKLLNELRIEQDQRANDCRGKGRWMAIVVSIAVIHLMVAVVWWRTQGVILVQRVMAISSRSSAATPLLQGTGYVTARRQATVSAQVTGVLVQLLIEEGDTVKAGQVIVRLDDSALRTELNTSLVSVEAAAAQLG